MRSNSRTLASGVIESIYFMSGIVPRPRWRGLFAMEIVGWCALVFMLVCVLVLFMKAFA